MLYVYVNLLSEVKTLPVDETEHILNLSTDIVIPTPWHPFSLANNLGAFDNEMKDEHFFVQNPAHHRAIILLPFRIGFVTNGNHRIAQAIMQGKRIGKPRYAEFGWVWEAYKHFHDI